MGTVHRRTHGVLTLFLAGIWMVTVAFADTAVTPAMHCQRHMPCCPQSGNGESCSSAQCTEQIPEKAEAQTVQAPERETVAVAPVRSGDAAQAAWEPVWELTTGLRYQASVFRLKDDLRI
jgi:hypothetical protein